MLKLKNPEDMPCGLSIGQRICQTQAQIFRSAAEKGFDEKDFSKKYMHSQFCLREMDALWSYFHLANPEAGLYEFLDEKRPKQHKKDGDIYAMEWIGWMYRYMQLRFEIPSNKIYRQLPYDTMVHYYVAMHNEDEEYIIDSIIEDFPRLQP